MVAVLGIGNVEVVAGDVHEFDMAGAGGPFDLGYTRAFLMHQADIHASAVAALKSRLVGTGVASGSEVDELELSLRQAASGEPAG